MERVSQCRPGSIAVISEGQIIHVGKADSIQRDDAPMLMQVLGAILTVAERERKSRMQSGVGIYRPQRNASALTVVVRRSGTITMKVTTSRCRYNLFAISVTVAESVSAENLRESAARPRRAAGGCSMGKNGANIRDDLAASPAIRESRCLSMDHGAALHEIGTPWVPRRAGICEWEGSDRLHRRVEHFIRTGK